MSEPSKEFQCRHIHTAGHRCRSASLRAEQFCYYHHTTRRPPPRSTLALRSATQTLPDETQSSFTLPQLEDRASIQLAVSEVVSRLTENHLDPRRAGLILYGLQIAAHVLPREPKAAPETIRQKSGNRREAAPSEQLVQSFLIDPELGPIAPVAEVEAPKAAARGWGEQLLHQFRQAPVCCKKCGHPHNPAMDDVDDEYLAMIAKHMGPPDPPDPPQAPTRALPEVLPEILPEVLPEVLPEIQAVAEPRRVPQVSPLRPGSLHRARHHRRAPALPRSKPADTADIIASCGIEAAESSRPAGTVRKLCKLRPEPSRPLHLPSYPIRNHLGAPLAPLDASKIWAFPT